MFEYKSLAKMVRRLGITLRSQRSALKSYILCI